MIYVITMAFAPPKMLEASYKAFRETIGLERDEYTHIFIDNKWPKDRDHLQAILLERLFDGDLILTPERNLGLAGGFNYGLSMVTLNDNDIVVGYDPDVFPVTKGWGIAFRDVMQNRMIGWVSMWNGVTDQELSHKPHMDAVIHGHNAVVLKEPILNSVCAFSGYFLRMTNGLHENQPYYGTLEIRMWRHLVDLGLHWVFLKDFKEGSQRENLIDQSYKKYKWVTCHGGEKQIEYSEWLKTNGHQ